MGNMATERNNAQGIYRGFKYDIIVKVPNSGLLGRGVSPLPTGYDWHGDAPLVNVDSDGFRPVVET